jgi:hypothetical protein
VWRIGNCDILANMKVMASFMQTVLNILRKIVHSQTKKCPVKDLLASYNLAFFYFISSFPYLPQESTRHFIHM